MDGKIRIVTKIISDIINAKGFWISEPTKNVILINNGIKITVDYISENENEQAHAVDELKLTPD